ncbi:MAG TPA: amylo-alpha-1,6-glucosidase [Candidatus Angelobacter sp.]|jgi:predicted glycogen debranching enzyme|nr:amylo-alpha-1,6-glucosidase [Candidatus Angelobacter sp.]
MNVISFDKSVCTDLEASLSREWLETNGLGGFACGTIAGANTRRYHGLLTAALNPPGGRVLLLSKLEETLVIHNKRIDLSTNEYDGAIHPEGYLLLTRFRLDPFPTWTFEVEGVELEKSIFMPQGSNTVQVEYALLRVPSGPEPTLEVRPLLAFRDYHSTTHENSAVNMAIEKAPNDASLQPYPGLPRLFFAHDAEQLQDQGYWYKSFLFRMERERGLDFEEDLFNPFALSWRLSKQQGATIIASTEQKDIREAASVRKAELQRRQQLVASSPVADPLVSALTSAADQFLVRRSEDWTVIAGYPWFTDWGRDTMISLPGLTLFTGRSNIARSILRNFARHTDRGMLPNRFVDSGEGAEFNSIDATLWFFEAVRAYAAVTNDYDLIRRELYDVLNEIIELHIKGTRYNIRMDDGGLLDGGAPDTQLTWMDAKIGNWVVTPRCGKPVEIQALWYNALRVMDDLATRFGDAQRKKQYFDLAFLASLSFNRVFWNNEARCLYDVVDGDQPDGSIRPNQIFAVSLHHSMLPSDRARAVVEKVERKLLTPFGLRTLSPTDARYRGGYNGDQYSRDSAYHQGTVWPWLLGPFVSAYVRVNDGTRQSRERAHELLLGIEQHLTEAGLGQISEIFDGDVPHRPRGCFAQAWSVAEILRVLCEDVYQVGASARH